MTRETAPSASHDPAEALNLQNLTPAFDVDPYTTFDVVRKDGPVTRITTCGLTAWMVTGYNEVLSSLTDPRLSSDQRHANPRMRVEAPWLFLGEEAGLNRNLLQTDGVDHARLRRIIGPAFSPRRIELLRPRIQKITDDLITAMLPHGHADFVNDFAAQLPVIVICELLGIPAQDADNFSLWASIAVLGRGDPSDVEEAWLAVHGYFQTLIQRRRRDADGGDGEDLLTQLIAARDEGALDDAELHAACTLILVAGYETTASLIGNSVLALINAPDQCEQIRKSPAAAEEAVDELMRLVGPLNFPMWRFATEQMILGGTEIAKGDVVAIALTAANRDPTVFVDPATLDLHRNGVRHLGFGQGPHYCLGATLARIETGIALNAIFTRCADLALAVGHDKLKWKQNRNVHCLQKLPVTFRPQEAE